MNLVNGKSGYRTTVHKIELKEAQKRPDLDNGSKNQSPQLA